VSLDFFDDILIPQRHMPDFSIFNPVQSTWIWKYKQSKDSEPHDMPTEKGKKQQAKVISVIIQF
jgi:DNA-directed RNA polymerase subunit E'/Rpb7